MTQIPNKEKYFNKNSSENGIFILGLAIGCFLTGIVYDAIFFPLSYYSSIKMSLDPFNIILFADIPSNLLDILVSQTPPDFFNLQVRPILFALGNLYGINGIILAFMFVSIKTNRLITFAIIANGIAGGYF